MAPMQDIDALIGQVALGNRAAFSALYSAVSPKLFGVLIRIMKDRAQAEDALQEVFVKVWHKAGSYRPGEVRAMTWLITIARNHAIDQLRRARPETTGTEAAMEMADPMPGPEAHAVARGESARLAACFKELEASHAEAVRKAYLRGESYKELAAHFGVPLNTMRTWLRRSLLKLKECLSR